MEKIKMYEKTQIITTNTTITPTDFGGWSAINIGDDPCTVLGLPIGPGCTVQGWDRTDLPVSVIYCTPIQIIFEGKGSNPKLFFSQVKFTE